MDEMIAQNEQSMLAYRHGIACRKKRSYRLSYYSFGRRPRLSLDKLAFKIERNRIAFQKSFPAHRFAASNIHNCNRPLEAANGCAKLTHFANWTKAQLPTDSGTTTKSLLFSAFSFNRRTRIFFKGNLTEEILKKGNNLCTEIQVPLHITLCYTFNNTFFRFSGRDEVAVTLYFSRHAVASSLSSLFKGLPIEFCKN